MSNLPGSHPYLAGDVVPFHLTASIVVASFFVSLIGSITTVELLQRRTNARGWQNLFELASCAVPFGLVAIWCMHYVGNRAIVMGNGEQDLQLVYNPGYTALSCFIPILAVLSAFWIADRRHRGKNFLLFALPLSGVVAGLAIAGMHYIGSLGVSNYHIDFNMRYVGGAIVIACSACVTALTLIFVLQDRWISILPYRLMTAVVLAGAVSGMHFEATMGATYRLKYLRDGSGGSRNTNVIIATVLSLITIPVCLVIAISTTRRQKLLADRAQQVFLACARFDPEGRLMVTHEGVLPSQKMTVQENTRSFEDPFNVNHPAFQWIFRLSHNWPSIVRWIPNMRRHLSAVNFIDEANRKKSDSSDSSLSWDLTPESEDYSVIFRQSFCVAASDLARDLNEPLVDIGTLYDGVLMTGTLAAGGIHRRRSGIGRFFGMDLIKDLEANIGVDVFGKGQLLVLVQECDKKETARLSLRGYRFVAIDHIDSHLARTLQVPQTYLNLHLKALHERARAEKVVDIPSGTLLGCFVLRAGISRRSWDVLVRKDRQYRLPCVQLAPVLLDPLTSRLLTQLDGLSVSACLSRLTLKIEDSDEPNREFWLHFKKMLLLLQESINEPFFRHAIFSSKLVRVPTLNPTKGRLSYCSLVAFHIIPDVHAASLKSSPNLTYTPLNFFRCRQQVREGVQHRASFDRRIHQEFATLFTTTTKNHSLQRPMAARRASSRYQKLPKAKPLQFFSSLKKATSSGRANNMKRLGSNNSNVPVLEMSEHEDSVESNMPFGGVMVTSDVTVESAPKEPGDVVTEYDFTEIGTSAYASTADVEVPTYVDELFTLAVARWRQA